MDNDVVRNSLTKEPFIPGSSLKGKLKALLKYNLKETEIKDNDIVFTDDTITNIFKGLEDKDNNKVVISRAIFRDFELTDDSKEELQRILNVFKGDDKDKMMEAIKKSLRLLELNYLGGNGTRGYGRVKIEMDDFKKVDIE